MKPLVLAAICAVTVQAQTNTFGYGERVEVATLPNEEAPTEAIVVAAPGDAVQLSRSGIVVNGRPARNLPAAFLESLPNQPVDLTVGSDEYLVAMRSSEDIVDGNPPERRGTRSRSELGRIPIRRIRKLANRVVCEVTGSSGYWRRG